MEIGAKIKNARADAQLTQEQAANALGVSRQTVSNWENGKTYPDIVSIIKMSNIYNISLDQLLKEEKNMSDYIDYLEESTNTVRSKNRLSKLIIIISYLLIWTISAAFYWIFATPSDAMAYALVFFWILQPLTIFILSLIMGINHYFGELKWLSPLIFGVMFMLLTFVTFDLNSSPEFSVILVGAVISVIGLALGSAIKFIKNKIRKKHSDN